MALTLSKLIQLRLLFLQSLANGSGLLTVISTFEQFTLYNCGLICGTAKLLIDAIRMCAQCKSLTLHLIFDSPGGIVTSWMGKAGILVFTLVDMVLRSPANWRLNPALWETRIETSLFITKSIPSRLHSGLSKEKIFTRHALCPKVNRAKIGLWVWLSTVPLAVRIVYGSLVVSTPFGTSHG